METYILLLILFFTTIVCGLLGFGDALLFIPLATFIVGLEKAVIFMTIWTSIPLSLNAIKYWKHLDWQFVIRGIITGIPGTIVGLLLVTYIPLRWVKLLLGIFLVIYTISRLYSVINSKIREGENSKQRNNLEKWILYAGGFSFGLFGALIGASGPINAILLERTDHHKKNFVGNFAIVSLILVLTRIFSYFAHSQVPIETPLVLVLGFPIALLSTKIGHYFAGQINERIFQIITLVVIGVIGLNSIFLTTIFF